MVEGNLATGVVLAGGLSRRMGGGDKGLLDIGGETMLGRVVRRLRPQVGRLILNANGDAGRFVSLRLAVVEDIIAGHAGPLAGVLAGMRWSLLHAPDVCHIVTVSSDVPFLPTDLVVRLVAAIKDRPATIALARSQGELHRVVGLWPVALADDLERDLMGGARKVLQWIDRHDMVAVSFDLVKIGDRIIDPFFNANTPADIQTVRAVLAPTST
jgi:molybdopterin-guanine dinucleotide biosynthesis protein A